jgi:hypothetical protein
VCGQHHAPAVFTPGKDPVPIVQEAGWAPEPVWIVAENLTPSGFDPRAFQPVASRYTDYAIPAPQSHIVWYKYTNVSDVPTATIFKLKNPEYVTSFLEGSTYLYQNKRCKNFEEGLLNCRHCENIMLEYDTDFW